MAVTGSGNNKGKITMEGEVQSSEGVQWREGAHWREILQLME